MYLMRAEGLGRFASAANVIVNLPFHPDAFLYIFLPILVFDAALNIEVRRMMEDAAPILLLAVVAVLVATVVNRRGADPAGGRSSHRLLHAGFDRGHHRSGRGDRASSAMSARRRA